MSYRTVVGVDGSLHGQAALRWAVGHALQVVDGDEPNEVVAVLAWQFPLLGIPGAFDRDELEQLAMTSLHQELAKVAVPDSLTLVPLVAEGDPTESLIEVSKGADLLVVGTRGRGKFAGLLLGSVCQGVAANAPCPVVMVKDADRGAGPVVLIDPA
jgi:nucleotide-binding universal stress UspA family protein